MGCCQQTTVTEAEVYEGALKSLNYNENNFEVPSPKLRLSLGESSVIQNSESSSKSKSGKKSSENRVENLPDAGKLVSYLKQRKKIASDLTDFSIRSISKIKEIDLEKNIGAEIESAKKLINNGISEVEDVIQEGYNQSAAIIESQIAIIKEGLEDAIGSIKDLNIKKRVTDIVFPILRKVFIHSVACEVSQKYSLKEIIGKGSLSVVKKAVSMSNNIERAVKIIVKNSLNDQQMSLLVNEIEVLKSLDHPNILRVNEVIEEVNKICIVSEICSGGELFDRIIQTKTFEELSAARIMYQILSGLIYIHKKGFVHKDLKPENIMFSDCSTDIIKIVDFSIAQKTSQSLITKKCVGSAYYLPPEWSEATLTEKYDIWSAGVILFILLSGGPPFTGKTEQEILQKSRQGVFRFSSKAWKTVSAEAKDLVKKMITKDLNLRISAAEAWSHPFIQNSVLSISKSPGLNKSMAKNFKKFRKTKNLQKAILAYITATSLSNKEILELQQAFTVLDTDGDGHLTQIELRRGFDGLSLSAAATVEEVFKSCDIDLNGTIDYNEFLTASVEWQKMLTQDLLEKVFGEFDTDMSGGISVSEIRAFLSESCDEGSCKRLVEEVDKNRDGEIDLQEFKVLMLSLYS